MTPHGYTGLVALTLLLGTAAQAANGLYVAANLAQLAYRADGLPRARTSAFGVKFGSQLSFNLAVEARAGVGWKDDTITVAGGSGEIGIDHHYGLYAKGIWPASRVFSAYALVGYTRGRVTSALSGSTASRSDSDLSYAIGAEYEISRAASFYVEWARLFRGTGYAVDGLSLGLEYRF